MKVLQKELSDIKRQFKNIDSVQTEIEEDKTLINRLKREVENLKHELEEANDERRLLKDTLAMVDFGAMGTGKGLGTGTGTGEGTGEAGSSTGVGAGVLQELMSAKFELTKLKKRVVDLQDKADERDRELDMEHDMGSCIELTPT